MPPWPPPFAATIDQLNETSLTLLYRETKYYSRVHGKGRSGSLDLFFLIFYWKNFQLPLLYKLLPLKSCIAETLGKHHWSWKQIRALVFLITPAVSTASHKKYWAAGQPVISLSSCNSKAKSHCFKIVMVKPLWENGHSPCEKWYTMYLRVIWINMTQAQFPNKIILFN